MSIDFSLSPELEEIRLRVRTFVDDVIKPAEARIEEGGGEGAERLRELIGMRKEAKAAGHRPHKLGKDPCQLGACFVFAPGNRDVFAHVSKTFGDNASVVKVLAALANLGRQGIKHSGADSNAREWDAAHPREP